MTGSAEKSRQGTPGDTNAVAEVLATLLRKIVRLLVGTISFPALVEMLRALYVEEGRKKLVRDGSKPTKSALALVTGLDTRVVSAVLANDCSTQLERQQVSPEITLIDMWSSDPFFQNRETGEAAILPVEGRGKSFQGLVLRAIGRNITVKTVLDRLLASNTVRLVEDEIPRVQLISLEYTPISNDRAELTDITFLEASRVISAGIHNMNSPREERVPQQGRWTYRLSKANYKKFRRKARLLLQRQIKEGEELLEEFEEPKKGPDQLTVGIGWYQWGDHELEEEENVL
ncbi:MAG: DUF6502 family protein [Xanthomonadales bacterium]|nr:DUF6502 family protein [Xanthomonadales bacterium]